MGRLDLRLVRALAADPAVRRETARLARDITDDAKARAPVRTGRTRRSLMAQSARDSRGVEVWRVGWDKEVAYWGPLVERGTRKTRARPHLRPAAERRR
jgi:HK97 gp10 family phage protein